MHWHPPRSTLRAWTHGWGSILAWVQQQVCGSSRAELAVHGQVACGGNHTVLLVEGGGLLAWGTPQAQPWDTHGNVHEPICTAMVARYCNVSPAEACHRLANVWLPLRARSSSPASRLQVSWQQLSHAGQLKAGCAGEGGWGQTGHGSTGNTCYPQRIERLQDIAVAQVGPGAAVAACCSLVCVWLAGPKGSIGLVPALLMRAREQTQAGVSCASRRQQTARDWSAAAAAACAGVCRGAPHAGAVAERAALGLRRCLHGPAGPAAPGQPAQPLPPGHLEPLVWAAGPLCVCCWTPQPGLVWHAARDSGGR